MTNKDKFLKDGITGNEIFNLAQELGVYLTVNCKASYVFASDINLFFQQPRTPTLTEDEKVILKNIDIEKYQYIRRDRNVFVFSKNIFKTGGKYMNTCPLPFNLFKFIKERRRI